MPLGNPARHEWDATMEMIVTPNVKEQVRRAAKEAMALYPNSHLGDMSRRQDLHSAFRSIRHAIQSGMDAWQAATYVYCDAQRYADM